MNTRMRRLAIVAGMAVAAVALSGCRLEPGAAAFVNGSRISDERIDSIVDSLSTDTMALPSGQIGNARQFVVNQVVLGEVAKRIVLAHKLTVIPMTAQAAAALRQAAQPTEIDRVYAETQPYLNAVEAAAAPVAPTPADQQQLALTLLNAGAPRTTISQFLAAPQFAQSLGYRKALVDGIATYQVAVSPRYAPMSYDLWSVQGVPLLSLSLTADAGHAVVDQPQVPQSVGPAAATS